MKTKMQKKMLALAALLALAAQRAPAAPASPVPTVQLTPSGRAFLVNRANQLRTEKLKYGLHPKDLIARGMSNQNDAVEKALKIGGDFYAPFQVNVAVPVTAKQYAAVPLRDPAVEAGARAQLRQQLKREPTAAEITAQVKVLDAGVAKLNAALAAQRKDIAASYEKTGEFPRAIEQKILGLPPGPADAADPAVADGLRSLFSALFNDAGGKW